MHVSALLCLQQHVLEKRNIMQMCLVVLLDKMDIYLEELGR